MKPSPIKVLSIALFFIGLALAIGSSFPRKALVGTDEWSVIGSAEMTPSLDRYLTSRDIFEHKTLQVWSSFSDGRPHSVKVVSKEFETPNFLSLLVAEGQNERHDAVFLECLTTNHKVPLIREHTNATFTERTVYLDPKTCGPIARVVLESDGSYFAAMSTPFKANVFHYLKYSSLASGFYFQLAFGAFLLFLIFCYSVNKSLPKKYFVSWGTIILFGLFSYTNFFIFWISKELGYFICTLCFIWGAYSLIKKKQLTSFVREHSRWLTLLYYFGLLFSMLLWLKDSGNFSWLPSTRFSPAEWSSDNLLPIFTAKAFLNGEQLKGLFGVWQITDRPPLFTGAVLVATPLWEIFRQLGLGDLGLPVLLAYAFILNSFWIYPLFYWRRFFNLKTSETVLSIAVLFCTSFIIFNTVYTWPKLFTVFLTFPSIIMSLRILSEKRINSTFFFLSLFGGALALQTHGGVIFYLLAVAFLAIYRRNIIIDNIRSLLFIIIATALLWVPWLLFKKFIIPSSGPLVKFAFAGTFGWDSQLSTLELIKTQYSHLSLTEWVNMKILGLKNWYGYFQEIDYYKLYNSNSTLGIIRKIQQTSILPSLFPFAVALPFLYLKVFDEKHLRDRIMALLYIGSAGFLINLIIVWSHHVNGHNSYPSIFCLFLACILTSMKLFPYYFTIFLAFLSSLPWFFSVLFVPTHIPIFNQCLILLTLVLIVNSIYRNEDWGLKERIKPTDVGEK